MAIQLLTIHSIIVLTLSWLLLKLARIGAYKVGLLDHPSERKKHEHPIPLAGGLATVPVLGLIAACYLPGWQEPLALISAMNIIFFMGILDDRFELSARLRLALQIIAAFILIEFAGVNITELGDLGGSGIIELGAFSKLFTAVCIVTTMNAFNMVDGSDGVLGALAIISLLSVSFYHAAGHSTSFAAFSALSALALIPYLSANLAPSKSERKVFMGDAGSMVIGLFVAYVVIKSTSDMGAYRPISAVFIIAVPIFDFLRVFTSRIARGVSPFTPERNHIHHVFLGYTGKVTTLILISVIAVAIAVSGAILSALHTPEQQTMWVFLSVIFALSIAIFLLDRRSLFIKSPDGGKLSRDID